MQLSLILAGLNRHYQSLFEKHRADNWVWIAFEQSRIWHFLPQKNRTEVFIHCSTKLTINSTIKYLHKSKMKESIDTLFISSSLKNRRYTYIYFSIWCVKLRIHEIIYACKFTVQAFKGLHHLKFSKLECDFFSCWHF